MPINFNEIKDQNARAIIKRSGIGKIKTKLSGNTSRKKILADLDNAWSLYIKLRDDLHCRFRDIGSAYGKCSSGKFALYENGKGECRVPQGLQAAHIIRRQNHRYRWDFKNGIALCTGHHLLFDGLWRDTGRSDELLVQLGILNADELALMKFTARQPAKVNAGLQMILMVQEWKLLSQRDSDCALIYHQLINSGVLPDFGGSIPM